MTVAFRRMMAALAASLAAACGGASVDPAAAGSLRAALGRATPCGPQVTRLESTLLVAPGGGEDTAALQCAIDRAAGGTVRLAPGVFHTAQIVARGFTGRLVGAGAGRTVLTNLDRPLPVVAQDFPFAPPSAEHPWPALLAFVDGAFAVSDLAIRIRGTEPTTGWQDHGFPPFKAMAAAIILVGTTTSADIARLDVGGEDAPAEPFFGLNLINGVYVYGLLGADPAPLAARVSVRDSVFAHLGSGAPTANLRFADVSITGNRFDGTLVGSEIVDVWDSFYRFADNQVATAWVAVDQYDFCLGPSSACGVARSRIQIADNRIRGGPVLLEGTLKEDVRCRIVDNAFADMGTPFDVYLGPGTHDCLVEGTPNVVDLGAGNQVVP